MNDFENNYDGQVGQDAPQQPTEPNFTEPTAAEPAEQPNLTEPQQPVNQPHSEPEPQPADQNGGYVPQMQSASYNYYNPNYGGAPNPSKKEKKPSGGFRVFCVLLAVIIALTVGAGAGYLIGGGDKQSAQPQNQTSEPSGVTFTENKIPQKKGVTADENGNYTVSQVAELVSPSVVTIYTYSGSQSGNGSSSGSAASGVIIDEGGYIISNDHIYSDIANAQFVVTLYDNRSYKATYVAGDQKSDICVLKIEGADNLTPASFGKSDEVTQGDTVVAIGTPYGMSNSVTSGIVSAANRRIRSTNAFSSDSTDQSTSTYTMRVIQTDTAINHGNSGGALVNLKGQVIGICSSKIVADTYEGICFAIPSNDAVSIAKNLIANKKVVGRAKLGISYVEISTASAVVNNIPSGLMIASIDSDSGLYNKGYGENDIICEIDGTAITTADIALDAIAAKTAGDTVTLKIYSSSTGRYGTVEVKLLEDQSVSSYKTESESSTDEVNPFKLQPTTTR